jgi:hypothetical protein
LKFLRGATYCGLTRKVTIASSTKFGKESKKREKEKKIQKKEKSDQKELSKSARDIQVLEGSIKVVIF